MSARLLVGILVGATAVVAGALNLPRTAASNAVLVAGPTDKAPAFSAKSPDGKVYDLAGLVKDGPGYLYFIKKDCPINAGAVGFYGQLYRAYGEKTPMLGVFNGSADEYKVYLKEHAMPFPVILDPDQKIITAYKAERSPWVVEVTQDKKIGQVWKGYSQDYLQQISGALATSLKAPAAKIDFSAAPKEPRYG